MKIHLIILISLGLVTACNQEAPPTPANLDKSNTETQKINSPKNVVHVSTSETDLKIGGSTELSIKLTIEAGYHINANPPTHSFLKATEIEVKPHSGFTIGSPEYPEPLVKKFEFDKEPLKVYEREAIIKIPVQATVNIKAGEYVLPAEVRIQACDDHGCLPPSKIPASFKIKVI
jgi:uncharacterized protein